MALSGKREVRIGGNGSGGSIKELRELVELTKDWPDSSSFTIYKSSGDTRDPRDHATWNINLTGPL
ncbi:hypothetical protein SEA_FORZA_128 [Gordonia phage Forza]|uniref:Uncharacterized protein n=1 Tax=Gordonia phage Forza TaxID=2571247 RepID=A0A650F0N1_9CAUD|nr:hypothetical protein PP303_gp128 [Gordonia phage Forza]QEM41595.1 hypothetical protein SEA_BOOPY_128 [Gordonia phage Boopy]QGT55121.1 hypothetical protein SEA_FORZA_128 [Gordonia phage Forza]UXE04269.1 hypothetical protein SEA_BLUENGOLD_127 [Gordonia phage BlueNGold]WBF03909.1 hypothetical protein SEA_MAREELIH_126 [Gordonia phage Mareelih]